MVRHGARGMKGWGKARHVGTKARRHGVGTRLGGIECECARAALDASLPWSPLRAFVPAFSCPRKTGGVVRFGEHFCAADFYKRGNWRGNRVKIVLDLPGRAAGLLVNGAQRGRGILVDSSRSDR